MPHSVHFWIFLLGSNITLDNVICSSDCLLLSYSPQKPLLQRFSYRDMNKCLFIPTGHQLRPRYNSTGVQLGTPDS